MRVPFARRSRLDVLEAQGLKAMLKFGQWKSPSAAEAYAKADEQTAHALGVASADFSDDDS